MSNSSGLPSQSGLNPEVTKRVAELARLALTPEEVERYSAQMAQVLGYIDQLKEVNVEGVTPLDHVLPGGLHWREDVAIKVERDETGALPVTKHAPSVVHDSFKVHGIL